MSLDFQLLPRNMELSASEMLVQKLGTVDTRILNTTSCKLTQPEVWHACLFPNFEQVFIPKRFEMFDNRCY